MTFEIEGIYQNGALILDQPLPLADLQRVRLIVTGKDQPRSAKARADGLDGRCQSGPAGRAGP